MPPELDPLLDLVLPRLEGVRRSGREWQARCPAHEDRNPSMGVARGDRQPVVFTCHAGCDQQAILDALGLTFADISNPRRSDGDDWLPCHRDHGKVGHEKIAEYQYRDAAGELVFTKDRCASKHFWSYRADSTSRSGKKWSRQMPDGTTLGDGLPYRLPQVLAAVADGETIYLVEGEKDVDRMWRNNLPATCNEGGASKSLSTCKWTDTHSGWLRGAKKIVVVADQDEPGRNHAQMAAASLRRAGCRLVLVMEPAVYKDMSDHFDAGYTIEQLQPPQPTRRTPPPTHSVTSGDPQDPLWGTDTPPEPPEDGETKPGPLRAVAHYQPTLGLPGPEPTDGPPLLPARFWTRRDAFQEIRAISHARQGCADAVLLNIMARVAAMTPHHLRIDTGIGTPACLNLMVAMVDGSGRGKSRAHNIGKTNLQRNHGVDFVDDLPLGSGEGMTEAYMGTLEIDDEDDGSHRGSKNRPRSIRTQIRNNAFFYLDEGESLFKLIERQGSILGPTMRTAWSGGTIGSQNATAERNRKAVDYSLGLVVGFQPHTAVPLLADVNAGTPQRFLWVPAIDRYIPSKRDDSTYPPINCDWELLNRPDTALTIDGRIKDALWEDGWLKATGQVAVSSQESQLPLMLVKISGLLAIMDLRTQIDVEDWALAWEIWDTSSAFRDQVAAQGQQQVEEEQRQYLERRRQVAEAEQEGRDAASTKRIQQAINQIVRISAQEDGVTRKTIKNALGSRLRPVMGDALEEAEEMGLITLADGHYRVVRGPDDQ